MPLSQRPSACVHFAYRCLGLLAPATRADRVDVHPDRGLERKHEGAVGETGGQLLPDMAALSTGVFLRSMWISYFQARFGTRAESTVK